MATAEKPTNERIALMLERILRELDEVKQAQDQLAADVREIAKQRTI